MPSPRWSSPAEVPITEALTAAVHSAWAVDERQAPKVFLETLHQLVGAEVFKRVELTAIAVYQLQRRPPANYEVPPDWAWFQICPGCQQLKKTPFTRAQNGRVELEVLRDPNWLQERFERGQTTTAIAARLKCSASLVVDWARKHDLTPPKTMAAEQFHAQVRGRHYDGEAPGAIARALETTVMQVRRSLTKQKIASGKNGHHYFEAEWWRVRLQDRRMKVRACALEAGIRPHAAHYYVKKFGLQEYSTANRIAGRPRKYPQLFDQDLLRELLARHETYESVAAELGCAPTLVSKAARDLLGAPKRGYPNQLPHSRAEWWHERIDAGKTTWEIAGEAGIEEKSVREKLRLLGLLDRAYANNTGDERRRRRERSVAA